MSILGAAAGGGFPQWNCNCENCRRLRLGTLRARPRTQIQVAVSADGLRWHLLGASPDISRQIESNPCFRPREGLRDSPIQSVILTCAEVDQSLGLLLLREFQPLNIYATPSVRRVLAERNTMFRMLHRVANQARWCDFTPGACFEIEPGMQIQTIPLPCGYPSYADAGLPPEEAVVGLAVHCGSHSALFLPGVPDIDDALLEHIARSDLLLLDGTFWSDDEFIRVLPDARTARAMGHLPISGHGGSLERLSGTLGPRKIYVHINNTNPILDEESAQHRAVLEAGWEIATDGMTIEV